MRISEVQGRMEKGRTELWPSAAEKVPILDQLSREMTTSSFVLDATTKNLDEGCQTTSTVYSDLRDD